MPDQMDAETPTPTILEACADPDLLNVSLSPAQVALLAGIYGLEMPSAECLALFLEATGRSEYVPGTPVRDASVLGGRRAGKSRCASILAAYESCVAQHTIPETERALVVVLGPTERQARTTFRVIERMIQRSPKLRGLVEGVRRGSENEITLSNGIDIRVLASNQRTVRGDLIVAAILEEACFFQDSDSGQFNLEEILSAIRPALLTLPDSKLIRVSSPWVASGPMFEDFQKRAERPATLAWKLESWRMNPSINGVLLWLEKKRDPAKFAREYGCEFLEAASALIPSDLIDRAVARGTPEFPNCTLNRCVAALDPASRRGDSFGFALAHKVENGKVVLDVVRQWKAPSSGNYINYGEVVPAIVERMNSYGATQVYSDQVCAAALSAEFAKHGISFEQAVTYGTRAQDLFQSVRQLFVADKVVLPDNAELISQLGKLEEQLAEGGKSVVQARSGHDDLAVAACLAIYKASLLPEERKPMICAIRTDDAVDDWKSERMWQTTTIPMH